MPALTFDFNVLAFLISKKTYNFVVILTELSLEVRFVSDFFFFLL